MLAYQLKRQIEQKCRFDRLMTKFRFQIDSSEFVLMH